MKNKDIIKKSIEENIVNSQTILNNMKAKAAQSVSADKKITTRCSFTKKAALLCTCLVLAIVFASSPKIFLNNSGGSSALEDTSEQEELSSLVVSTYAVVSQPAVQSVPDDVQSRSGQGTDNSVIEISKTPLNDEDRLFFESFAEKAEVMRRIMSGLLESDIDAQVDGFAPVTELGYSKLSDISDFFSSLFEPVNAQQYYLELTIAENPIYKEINGILYQRMACQTLPAIEIFTDTAYYADNSSAETLKINCLVCTEGQQYYFCFFFKNVNDTWYFDYSKENN